MYTLPPDVQAEIQRQFKLTEDQSRRIIHTVIDQIISKTLSDGCCIIRSFGKFLAYKTFSIRTNRQMPRFKFKLTPSLTRKLNSDKYLIDHLEIQSKCEFNENHEEICKSKRELRDSNYVAQAEATKLGKKKSKEKIAATDILSMLEDDDFDDEE